MFQTLLHLSFAATATATVRSLVEPQPPTVPEPLPTLAAHIRLLPGVDAEVPGERPRVAERHGAHRAGVRPLSRVDAQVGLQVLHAVEVPGAHGAVEGAAPGGVELELAAGAHGGAGLGRLGALLVRPLLTLAVVPAKLAGLLEHLAAGLAHVDVGGELGGGGCGAGPGLDPVQLWWGWDASGLLGLEEAGELGGEGWKGAGCGVSQFCSILLGDRRVSCGE